MRLLAREIIGVIPSRSVDKFEIPVPYRATVEQSRAAWKVKGSQFGEPGEVPIVPISEVPTP